MDRETNETAVTADAVTAARDISKAQLALQPRSAVYGGKVGPSVSARVRARYPGRIDNF